MDDLEHQETEFPLIVRREHPPERRRTALARAGWQALRRRPAGLAASAGIMATWALREWLRARQAPAERSMPRPASHVDITVISVQMIVRDDRSGPGRRP